jgi:hypothetical protein
MQTSAEHGANRKTLLHKWCKTNAHQAHCHTGFVQAGPADGVPLQLHVQVVLEEAAAELGMVVGLPRRVLDVQPRVGRAGIELPDLSAGAARFYSPAWRRRSSLIFSMRAFCFASR